MKKTKEEIEEILKNATDWNTAKIQDMVGDRSKKKYTTKQISPTPCTELDYCPYGYLVEFFPLEDRDEYSCDVFGHDCPVYYLAEGCSERTEKTYVFQNDVGIMVFIEAMSEDEAFDKLDDTVQHSDEFECVDMINKTDE